MPVSPTYPGVYIQEVPSGVRTITGVATSITAFVGGAFTGPVNDPTIINSFADFERFFGSLDPAYPMSYAVQDFYANGGAQAVIVRLFQSATSKTGGKSTNGTDFKVTSNGKDFFLTFEAPYPGKDFDRTTIAIDTDGIDDDVAKAQGLAKAELFNLTVQYDPPDGPSEKIRIVSVVEGPRRVDRVLAQESQFLRVHTKPDGTPDPELPPTAPKATDTSKPLPVLSGGADSDALQAADFIGDENTKTGIYALNKTDLFNLLCIPPPTVTGTTDNSVYVKAAKLCVDRRAMLIVDPPAPWDADPKTAVQTTVKAAKGGLAVSGPNARNASIYFPRLIEPDQTRKGQLTHYVPCGSVAGIMARTDAQRGVWKAPAGLDATLNTAQALTVTMNDSENGQLNQLGVNCLRSFGIAGLVVWGARTMRGADSLGDEYKYVPVRRTALFIEESLYRGTQWVVFEPNDEPLWAQIRLNVGAFMQNLFRQGAFQGKTPQDAYFVKCDKDTTTQNDINLGIVNIVVGFAPLKPAEFVIISIQQMAGQIAT
jgi:phage tail sheath protein FI